MKFSLLVTPLSKDDWEKHKDPIRGHLAKIKGHYVELSIGIWILKTKKAYPIIHALMTFFQQQQVTCVLLPIDAVPPVVHLSADMAQRLEDFGVEVYNIALPDQTL